MLNVVFGSELDMTLVEQLQALGAGGVVMVHASMRAVGGRAEDLVRALLSVCDTVMAYVDFELTADVPCFDVARSPAAAGYGVLAEVIRTWPSAMRSAAAGASMAAIGARAQWLCADHPVRYGYGPGSPLAKLVEAGGAVLLLGSDPDQVTLLHYAEHLARLPGKRVVTSVVPCTGGDLHVEEFDTSRAAIQRALADVDDALAAYAKGREQLDAQRSLSASSAAALKLANVRYTAGVSTYLEVLDAERQLFSAQLSETRVQGAVLIALVRLYAALGGGWSTSG